MRYIFILLLIDIGFYSCSPREEGLLYGNDDYKLYHDRVVQGPFQARALSDSLLLSNYEAAVGTTEDDHKEWRLKNDISSYPLLESSNEIEVALYNMALDEMINSIESDSTFRTGEKWAGVWTRDVSYSILLSMAYMQPDVSSKSLLHKIDRLGRIVQDTGTGGSWPCSSDRMVWIMAAWEIYKITGETGWLRRIYEVAQRSLEDDFFTVYDLKTGLVMGESSFIDWRDQSYPEWMEAVDIYQSKCLGTNAVHYQALNIMANIAEILHRKDESCYYGSKARKQKKSINDCLWQSEKGFYAQYLYGRNSNICSQRSETLGEALAILTGIASEEQGLSICDKMPLTSFGPTIFFPQIGARMPYHDNASWPFVTSFWALASAKMKNDKAVLHAIASIYRAAALFVTNKENFVASNGDWSGTAINSNNMLWSLAGNIAVMHRILFGMNFGVDSMVFQPFIPQELAAERKLLNFRYRDAVLDIEVSGYGDGIERFTIDGVESSPVIGSTLSGRHKIGIVMNNRIKKSRINFTSCKQALATPVTRCVNNHLCWDPIEGAVGYLILRNGQPIRVITETIFDLDDVAWGEYQVIAMSHDDLYNSFASQPFRHFNGYEILYNVDSVSITSGCKEGLRIPVKIPVPGSYSIDWKYANGNGPVTTMNKCAIRTLLVNGKVIGTSVFPQRGENSWTNRGWSNQIHTTFLPGNHTVELVFLPHNHNMNIEVNEAIIHQLRLTKID